MTDTPEPAYQVLARKYRPQSFDQLIGQEAMVRVLSRAFETGRIAHAFVLTGVRGVGKTTTARIIAKGLNCGAGEGPTITPCGQCDSCRRIAEGRDIDVMEIDAASHTGVDFVRDLNDMAQTRPTGRFRVFILDEVHMLSTQAFNALLKTLEEPPAHVKFIFATTEIRKVPVTVLSRCQRFDLRRIEPEAMLGFLAEVAAKEGAQVAPEGMALITRAAEGSMRDALSLLDQAIAHGGGSEAETTAETVRAMLGLADRGRTLDLFEAIMRGDAAGALGELSAQYAEGADPASVLRDLAELAHWISVVRITPEAADDPTVPPVERARGRDLAQRLPMRSLARAWQMLLKALQEVSIAPSPMMAAEMAVIRLTHVADLPSPEDLVRRLTGSDGVPLADRPTAGTGGNGGGAPQARSGPLLPQPAPRGQGGTAVARLAAINPAPVAAAAAPAPEGFARFEDVVALIREKRDAHLLVLVETHVRLIRHTPGRIVFEPGPGAPDDLAGMLARRLSDWTGARWMVSVEAGGGAPSIAEARRALEGDLRARAEGTPLVAAALALFPGATIKGVRPLDGGDAAADAPEEGPPGLQGLDFDDDDPAFGDDWEPVDPFDED
jgi:DNA polymerase-3 subunit gamma/tau